MIISTSRSFHHIPTLHLIFANKNNRLLNNVAHFNVSKENESNFKHDKQQLNFITISIRIEIMIPTFIEFQSMQYLEINFLIN